MNSTVLGLRVASAIFGLVCLGHVVRLLWQLEILVAGRHIPVWWSAPAVIVSAILCVWLWRLSLPLKSAEPHEPTGAGHPSPV